MDDGRPAGFWIRAVAALLDFAVIFVVQMSFGWVAARVVGPDAHDSLAGTPLVWVFTVVFAVAYTSVLHAGVGGQTVGKSVVRVRLVTAAGGAVPLGAALLRHVAYVVSLVPFGIGFLMAGLRHDKRALHDLIAGTRVERAQRNPGAP